MNELITLVNDVLWGYVLIGTLVFCGLWFTWNTRGVQFRMIGEMFRLLTDSAWLWSPPATSWPSWPLANTPSGSLTTTANRNAAASRNLFFIAHNFLSCLTRLIVGKRSSLQKLLHSPHIFSRMLLV